MMDKKSETPGRSKVDHRKKIFEKRNEILQGLTKELAEVIKKGPELKLSLGSDTADLSILNLNSDLSVSIAKRYSNMLRQIDRALERVEEGTYGRCEECGEEVDRRRLEILPFASHCIQCQRRMEEKHSKK